MTTLRRGEFEVAGRLLAQAPFFAIAPLAVVGGHALTRALRRIARAHPGVFERLGAFQHAAFLIAPDELPFAFRVEPDGRSGVVRIVPRNDPRKAVVRISGAIADLLRLLEGSIDADAAFFARTLDVEGDVSAALALHNTIEAAGLSLADIVGVPAPVVRVLMAPLRRGPAPLARLARGA